MRHSILRGPLVFAFLALAFSLPGAAGEAQAASQNILTPSAFDFGYVTMDQPVSMSFPLRNVSARPIVITGASLVDWPGSLTLALPLLLSPGQAVMAGPLTFAPAATGRYSSAIEFTTDDPSWPLAAVPVTGKALAASPSMVAIPSAFDFGYVTVGQSSSRSFRFANVSAHSVQITAAALMGWPGFPADLALALPVTLQPGETVQAGSLTFRPSSAGWFSSYIELTTDDPSTSLVAVPIWGQGASPGASPGIVAIPGAFDFGYVTVGQSVSEYFQLKNVSDHRIRIAEASLADWPGSLTLALPVTLQPEEVVMAGPLTFEPTATGRYSSAIELTTDDPSWPLAAVPVTGKALAASPAVVTIPRSFDFGYVTVGQSESRYFPLKNVGTQAVTITAAALTGRPAFPGDLAPLALPLTLQPEEVVIAGPLTFGPTAAGWYSSAIELTTDDASSSLVALPVWGKAASPAVLTVGPVPSFVDYGASVELTGTLSSSTGTPLSRCGVVLETSANGAPWNKDAQTFTSSTGTFTLSSLPLASAAYVRLAFEGDSEWAPAVSTATLVKPRASLGTPVAPATMSPRMTYTVSGSLEPAHTAGVAAGKLYCYRLESERWVLRDTFTIRAYANEGQDRYRARVLLPLAGRWRMRAYHSDAGHAPTYSGWSYVTVR